MAVGDLVRLKINRTGIIWNDGNTGTSKRLGYTVHNAYAGDMGVVVPGIFSVVMDNGIEISCNGNDFIDPDEQFKETFEIMSDVVWFIPRKKNGPVTNFNRLWTMGRTCEACGEKFLNGQLWTIVGPNKLPAGPNDWVYLHWDCFKTGTRTIDVED